LNRSCYCTSADIPALQRWLWQDLESSGLASTSMERYVHLFSAAPVFVAREHAAQIRGIIEAIEATIALPA
jgi:hypothetical protein